jgi:hypothetical protein
MLLIVLAGCRNVSEFEPTEQVVLLHGLGRTSDAMYLLRMRIDEAGFKTHTIQYDSLKESPDSILEMIAPEINDCCRNNGLTTTLSAIPLGG